MKINLRRSSVHGTAQRPGLQLRKVEYSAAPGPVRGLAAVRSQCASHSALSLSWDHAANHAPPRHRVLEIAAGAIVVAGLGCRWRLDGLAQAPTAEELEVARRQFLTQSGRLVDGTLLDVCEVPAEDGRILTMLLYGYRIGGVDYECTQDVTSMHDVVDVATVRAGFPCSVRYQSGNPQNSIVVSEKWSGLRASAPVSAQLRQATVARPPLSQLTDSPSWKTGPTPAGSHGGTGELHTHGYPAPVTLAICISTPRPLLPRHGHGPDPNRSPHFPPRHAGLRRRHASSPASAPIPSRCCLNPATTSPTFWPCCSVSPRSTFQTRPADDARTFGYQRAGVLAAFINAGTLILISIWIGIEAVHRLYAPVAVQPRLMMYRGRRRRAHERRDRRPAVGRGPRRQPPLRLHPHGRRHPLHRRRHRGRRRHPAHRPVTGSTPCSRS